MSGLVLLVSIAAACAAAGCADRVDSGPPVVAVPADPWVLAGRHAEPAAELFASCAACHMADASGRADGTIPRLAGQHAAIIVDKLQRIRDGKAELPVMLPFARALTVAETEAIAAYVAQLPTTIATPLGETAAAPKPQEFAALCAACHGPTGEGIEGLRSPRLCGQHAAYLARRLDEIALNTRGDADPAMAAIVASLTPDRRMALATWLASGVCTAEHD